MLAIEGVPHLSERSEATWPELDGRMLERGKGPRVPPMAVFDIGENGLRLFQSAVGNEPTRRLRDPCAQEQIESPRKAPVKKAARQPKSGARTVGSRRTTELAAPMAAPIQKLPLMTRVGPSAIAGRDELLDGRGNRRVFAADAGPGQEAMAIR
jgi:hypothetical protein